MASTGLRSLFSRFNRQFWVVNTFELFERGAYYGMMAIFVLHFSKNIGIPYEVVGVALGLLMPLLYFMPLVASALAEKYGYKPAFIVSFIIIMVAYMSLYYAKDVIGLFASVVALGIGAGAFKPMVSATIAHVTDQKDRSLAYSIYYWMINFGAFIFPLVIAFYVEIVLGDLSFYNIAFVISTIFIGVNLAICFLVFKDPSSPKRDKKIVQAFIDLAITLKDRTFMILLLVYAGFWFMFSLNHSFLPIYVLDFGHLPSWFLYGWIAIINPGTIIFAGPALSVMVDKISTRFTSLQLMIFGMSLFISGLLVVGWVKSFAGVFAGIIIFSIGEFLTHPNFISYVSKIAPKDRVAIYMGYAFIPTGIGYSTGSAASGFLYGYWGRDMHMPTMFWSIVAAVGLLTVTAFLLYNIWYRRQPRAKQSYDGKIQMGKMWTSKITPLIVLCIVPVVLVAGFQGGTDTWYGDDVVEETVGWARVTDTVGPIPGSSDENTDTEERVNISVENVINVTITLTWQDEADPGFGIGRQNQPDEFSLKVETPDGLVAEEGPVSNAHGQEQSITVTITRDGNVKNRTKDKASGDYIVTISMGEAGDSRLPINIGPTVPDNGNDWTLEIEYDFYEKVKVENKEG